MAEMAESIRRQALDRVEWTGAVLLVMYLTLTFGMYLQYLRPN